MKIEKKKPLQIYASPQEKEMNVISYNSSELLLLSSLPPQNILCIFKYPDHLRS